MQGEGRRRYRVLGTIGKGGFGTVYKAELVGEGGFSRLVALKVLNPGKDTVADFARRLRDEARVLGMLRHRSIVHVDGLVVLDGRWTVVMEYIRGVDLGRLVAEAGRLPERAALELAGETAAALSVAYEWTNPQGEPLQLLHRDIKPSNLLLTSAGEVKVLDFGVARAQFAGREAVTRSVRFGSMKYLAPERLDMQDGPAGDVYALGAVLYELLVGQALGQSSVNPRKHAERVALGERNLRHLHVQEPIVELVTSMVAWDPTVRPVTRQVERRCRDLMGSVASGDWLRDYAERAVPPILMRQATQAEHDFSEPVLTEQSSPRPADTVAFSIPPEDAPPDPTATAPHAVPMPPVAMMTWYGDAESPSSVPPLAAQTWIGDAESSGPRGPIAEVSTEARPHLMAESRTRPLPTRHAPRRRTPAPRSSTGLALVVTAAIGVPLVLLVGSGFLLIILTAMCAGMGV